MKQDTLVQNLLQEAEQHLWELVDICEKLKDEKALRGVRHGLPGHVHAALRQFFPSQETNNTLNAIKRKHKLQSNPLNPNQKDMSNLKFNASDFGVSLDELRELSTTKKEPKKKEVVAEGKVVKDTNTQPSGNPNLPEFKNPPPPSPEDVNQEAVTEDGNKEETPQGEADAGGKDYSEYLDLTDEELVDYFGNLKGLKTFAQQEFGLEFSKNTQTKKVCEDLRAKMQPNAGDNS